MSVIVSNSTLNSFPPSIPNPSYPHQRQNGLVQNCRLITNGNDKVMTRNIVPLSLNFVYQTSVALTVYTLCILFIIVFYLHISVVVIRQISYYTGRSFRLHQVIERYHKILPKLVNFNEYLGSYSN